MDSTWELNRRDLPDEMGESRWGVMLYSLSAPSVGNRANMGVIKLDYRHIVLPIYT